MREASPPQAGQVAPSSPLQGTPGDGADVSCEPLPPGSWPAPWQSAAPLLLDLTPFAEARKRLAEPPKVYLLVTERADPPRLAWRPLAGLVAVIVGGGGLGWLLARALIP